MRAQQEQRDKKARRDKVIARSQCQCPTFEAVIVLFK
jgi:hypothetical protein